MHSNEYTALFPGICFIDKMGLNRKTIQFKVIDITMVLY